MMKFTEEQRIEAFWSKVDKSGGIDGCWIWTAGKTGNGYGSVKWKGKQFPAHRIAYFLHFGNIPDNLFACHKCDNPACVNPNHLFMGTHQENVDDRERKNRNNFRAGERHPLAKLTDDEVEEIRQKYAKGNITYKELALEYQVSDSNIYRIINRINRKIRART